jgi:hypothetical protein
VALNSIAYYFLDITMQAAEKLSIIISADMARDELRKHI